LIKYIAKYDNKFNYKVYTWLKITKEMYKKIEENIENYGVQFVGEEWRLLLIIILITIDLIIKLYLFNITSIYLWDFLILIFFIHFDEIYWCSKTY